MVPVAQHLHAVHPHVSHAGRQLVRLLGRRDVDDGLRIEHHHVREHALAQQAAVAETQSQRHARRHLADRILEREHMRSIESMSVTPMSGIPKRT